MKGVMACVLLGAALASSSCQGSADSATVRTAVSGPSPAVSEAHLFITPANGTRRVDPGAPITVQVTRGTLATVTVAGAAGRLEGRLNDAGTVWQSVQTLHMNTRYTVRATAVDAEGRTTSATSRFRTLRPAGVEETTIFEGFRQTYGVGMPIILTFSHPVVYKRAVESALEVRSSKPVVGAWYWDGDSTLYFRPRTYWPAHTTVQFVGHLDGVEAAPGVFGAHTLTQTFTIGSSLIAVADTSTHRVRIYRDLRLFADWPMSSGKPGDDTPNGTYLTIEKHNPVEMKGPGYDIQVPWSVRFTWSGDYLHDAFWSVGQQGFANVSHGCVNLSPADAETYYNLAVPGDPVTIMGSPRGGVWGNGWTVWFLSWRELVRGSALHQAVRVRPDGSTPIDPATGGWRTGGAPLRTSPPHNADPA
jgi:lipoprotein-anchoring transpeptidase ErfK/SrfK